MPELDKVHPELNVLAALSLAFVDVLAVAVPMAVAIIWVCS
jgi:hypothetical protein